MIESKRIMLVEDNPNDVELALSGLSDYNLADEVVVMRDGVEALDYLFRRNGFSGRPEGNPAVVLLDLKLPRVGGIEVLTAIKNDASLRMMPVVVLTSSREDRDLIESYRLGVNAYVVKPIDFHEFIEAVRQLGIFWAVINEPPPGCIANKC